MSKRTEFWRINMVIAVVGLSRSEIYRRVAAGTFPQPRKYSGGSTASFWVSDEIHQWQRQQLDG
jgi:prophage regulatory protein